MSILSKPWRASLQHSPNLLSFLTAKEVQTRRAGSARREHKDRPTKTQTCKERAVSLNLSHGPRHNGRTRAGHGPDVSLSSSSVALNSCSEASVDPNKAINTWSVAAGSDKARFMH